MKRVLLVLLTVTALAASACGASGDEGAGGEEEEGATTTEATSDQGSSFGDIESPCGPGDFTIAEGEQGTSGDKFYIGVGNDRSAEIRPGLNKEVWDASVSFADWCNAQGGLGGKEISLVDLDAQLFQVEAAMTKACTETFAMVGGAMTQDQLQFSGKDGSDFHKCGMIDIPAFAVSVQKGLSNGHVQPIPNPPNKKSEQWIMDFQKLYPEESEKNVVVYGELPSLKVVKLQYDAAVQAVGGIEQLPAIQYPVAGANDWTPYAQKVIDSGATSLYWIGEPGNAANLFAKLREQKWEGVIINETNVYDQLLFSAGDAAAEGALVRLAVHPFEEADKWPAVQQYLDNLKNVPDGKQAALGLQSTSAWLLFATAVNACAEKNDNVVSRECVMDEAAAVDEWTGGGLHVPTDPGGSEPPECGMLVVATDEGTFERKYPELGGTDDDLDGFHCPPDSIATVTEELGAEGAVDPNR